MGYQAVSLTCVIPERGGTQACSRGADLDGGTALVVDAKGPQLCHLCGATRGHCKGADDLVKRVLLIVVDDGGVVA